MAARYSDYVYYAGTSEPVIGVFITVYNTGTQDLTALYDINGDPIDNPVTTDQTGKFEFYVNEGDYDIWIYGKKDGTISMNSVTTYGDVYGPVSSILHEVALFNSTDGKAITGGGLLGTAAFANIATTAAVGTVKPDGTTITIDGDGIISSSGGSIATYYDAGIVKPDGTSVTIDIDGTIHSSGGTSVYPGDVVTVQTSFGLSSASGLSDRYARIDHAHGTPSLPSDIVTGPASSTNGNFALFDQITGKVIKDGGQGMSYFATAANFGLHTSATTTAHGLGSAAFVEVSTLATQFGLTTHEGLTNTAHGGIVSSSDSRLTDARTPTAHKTSHSTGQSDALAPSDIGALALSGGTLTGNTIANTGTDYTTSRLRNIKLMTTTPVAGDFDGNGSIIGVYAP